MHKHFCFTTDFLQWPSKFVYCKGACTDEARFLNLVRNFFSDQSCVLVINMFWRQFREQSENGQNWWKMAIFSTFCPLGTGCGTWYETFFWWILCFGYIHVLVAKTVSRSVSNGQKGWKWPFLALFAPWGLDVKFGAKIFSCQIMCFSYIHVLVRKKFHETVIWTAKWLRNSFWVSKRGRGGCTGKGHQPILGG